MEWNFLYKLEKKEADKHKSFCHLKPPNIVDIIHDNGIELKRVQKIPFFALPQQHFYPLDLTKTEISHGIHEKCISTNLDKVEHFLTSKSGNRFRLHALQSVRRVTICTERGVLYRFMNLPYDRDYKYPDQNYRLFACKVHNVVFLVHRKKIATHLTTMDFRYLQLKKFCLTDAPGQAPNTDAPLNVNDETYGIYHAKLGKFDLIYSAEMPGSVSKTKVQSLTELNKSEFIQLKLLNEWSSRYVGNIWAQARLVNASTICLASVNQEGQVRSPLKLIDAKHKPKINNFDERVPFRFLHTILSIITKKMSGVSSLSTVYEFNYQSGKLQYRVHHRNDNYRFLSEKFVQHVKRNWIQ